MRMSRDQTDHTPGDSRVREPGVEQHPAQARQRHQQPHVDQRPRRDAPELRRRTRRGVHERDAAERPQDDLLRASARLTRPPGRDRNSCIRMMRNNPRYSAMFHVSEE